MRGNRIPAGTACSSPRSDVDRRPLLCMAELISNRGLDLKCALTESRCQLVLVEQSAKACGCRKLDRPIDSDSGSVICSESN
jgi:hypothetical protein